MNIKTGKPHQRSKISSFRLGVEELKFLKSQNDLKILFEKMTYLMPRTIGTLNLSTKAPLSLQIEPTNYCNVQCICCPTSRSVRQRGFMDVHLFQKIIDDAAHIGVKRVRLFLHGEPLLHPQIVEMISYAKTKGLAIHVTTNGMDLNLTKMAAILHSGVNCADHFAFSVFGFSKEVHERIMKRANYNRVELNINNFMELRKKYKVNGPIIETIFFVMPQNSDEEDQYRRYWQGKVDHVRLGGNISASFAAYKNENQKIPLRSETCSNIWERMTVFWNGDVSLCCEDVDGDWILGNLREQSIQEVWNSEQLFAVKRIHLERQFWKFPFCHSCDM